MHQGVLLAALNRYAPLTKISAAILTGRAAADRTSGTARLRNNAKGGATLTTSIMLLAECADAAVWCRRPGLQWLFVAGVLPGTFLLAWQGAGLDGPALSQHNISRSILKFFPIGRIFPV